jgi:excinuclease UvrABC nuclease subunit
VFEIRTQNKANLISSIVNGETDTKTNLIKEVINDPNPTTLEGVNPTKGKQKKLLEMAANNASKKRD